MESDSATRWQSDIAAYAVPHPRLRAIAGLLAREGATSVTDVGCATGTLHRLLGPGVEYHGIDFVNGLEPGLRFTEADLNGRELPPVAIDSEWIVCSGVLEYVRDVPRLLTWLRTSSRPGTRLILSYFNDTHVSLRWRRVRGREVFGHPDWVPLMVRTTLLARLADAGYTIGDAFDLERRFGTSPDIEYTGQVPVLMHRADWRSTLLARQWIFVVS